jgi:[lysine-biosynthesis-protein LysW]---L-2-aminoadipate ligase
MSAGRNSIFAERRHARSLRGKVWIVSGRSNATDDLLVGALHESGVGAQLVAPTDLIGCVRPEDTVVGRLDVRKTLDGIEDGLAALRRVELQGNRTLNPAPSLLACHDKLQTAIRLGRSGIPHPRTAHVDSRFADGSFPSSLVVKPRFGSWGRDVFRCDSERELRRCFRKVSKREWFRRQGALVQEFVPSRGYDLRLVVAGGEVVGAIKRVAASGEWRTNVALGARREPVIPTPSANALAVAAAQAVGGDLVGVDLLPLPGGGYLVLEVNGAVDLTAEYSFAAEDVFGAVARRIASDSAAVSIRLPQH